MKMWRGLEVVGVCLVASVVRGVGALSAGPWTLTLFSPAKVNLFLRVLGKRDDGFHELASLFQAIDLGDVLRFAVLPAGAETDEISCNIQGLPVDESNLVTRAIGLYRKKVPTAPFVKCALEKKLPMEAGLGGGSSNAATTLYAMNELAGRPASTEDLIEWSGELGSDITFFLGDTGTAYCTGRGEIIEPLPKLSPTELFVVKPKFGLSTPLVFKTLASTGYSTLRDDLSPRDDLLPAFLSEAGPGPSDYVNDLEAPAFEINPALADIKAKLADKFPAGAMMSGSGTSLFAVLDQSQTTDLQLETFPADFQRICLDDLGVDVDVWRCAFAFRDASDQWYQPADPGLLSCSSS